MIWAAIACFGIAAIFGGALANGHIKGKPLPTGVALAHGGIAAAGVLLLIVLALQGWMPGLGIVSIAVFAGAAVGGVVLFSARFRGEKKSPPAGLIVGHALTAVVALALLLVSVL